MNESGEKGSQGHGKEVVIFVNNREFKTREQDLTGAQIKALAGIPADYELFETKGDQTTPVGDDQPVHLENGIHFRALPSGTFGAIWHCYLG